MLTSAARIALLGTGRPKGVVLPGVGSSDATSPSSSATQITGDIDLRGCVAPLSWSAPEQNIVGKWSNGTGNFSYFLNIDASGHPKMYWSPGGASTLTATASVIISSPLGSPLWVRCTLQVNNGSSGYTVTFFTSTDGVVWIQLGSAQTGTPVTSIVSNTSPVSVGSFSGSLTPFLGTLYRAQIYSGIGGTLVFDANFSDKLPNARTFLDRANGAVITLNGSLWRDSLT